MLSKIVSYTNKEIWISFILILSYLNATLKYGIEGNLTAFRLFLPIVIIQMLNDDKVRMIKFIFFGLFVVLYSYIVSLQFSPYNNFNFAFSLHYVLVPFCFYLMDYFVKQVGVVFLYRFFERFYYVMIVLCFIQLFFGGLYPNIQDRSPMVSIFFWNENELTTVFAVFIPIYFLIEKNIIKKIIWILLGLFFIVYSDARLLIIGLFVFFTTYFLVNNSFYRYRFLWIVIIIPLVLILLVKFIDVPLFDEITIRDLLVDSTTRIITLQEYDRIGSFTTRINSYIWGFIDLRESYFMGIGPANSFQLMLDKIVIGQEDFSAKSFHNILLQMIVELGILGIWLFWRLIVFIKTATVNSKGFKPVLVLSFYIAALIFSTILSGAFSNYPFIFIIAFSYYLFQTENVRNKILIKQ